MNQACQAEHTHGLFHRVADWLIFPASVAAICTAVAGPLFGLVELATGQRTGNTEVLQAVVAVLSATIAALVTKHKP